VTVPVLSVVVDDKINDVADRSFAGLDGVAAESLCALQMKIVACLLTRHKIWITTSMSLCCGFASRCFSHSSSSPRRTALCRLGSSR
jgi:hypothetical protein